MMKEEKKVGSEEKGRRQRKRIEKEIQEAKQSEQRGPGGSSNSSRWRQLIRKWPEAKNPQRAVGH